VGHGTIGRVGGRNRWVEKVRRGRGDEEIGLQDHRRTTRGPICSGRTVVRKGDPEVEKNTALRSVTGVPESLHAENVKEEEMSAQSVWGWIRKSHEYVPLASRALPCCST
jgi:hypothetical protein